MAGGGVLYSDASAALRRFAEATGIAVAETQAGKSAIPSDHPLSAGAVGVTGTLAANRLARDADLVIAIGTRLADFTTMSNTGFANPDVQFIGINVCEMDAFKRHAIPVIADARSAIDELRRSRQWLHDDCRVPANASDACEASGTRKSHACVHRETRPG